MRERELVIPDGFHQAISWRYLQIQLLSTFRGKGMKRPPSQIKFLLHITQKSNIILFI